MYQIKLHPLDFLLGSGHQGLAGWISIVLLIIAWAIALFMKPQERKDGEHWFFGFVHVQFLVFMLTYPLAKGSAAYATLAPIPHVYAGDMAETTIGILFELLICITAVLTISWRHTVKPKYGSLAILCVIAILSDTLCYWSFRMVLATTR